MHAKWQKTACCAAGSRTQWTKLGGRARRSARGEGVGAKRRERGRRKAQGEGAGRGAARGLILDTLEEEASCRHAVTGCGAVLLGYDVAEGIEGECASPHLH